ncbi:transcriptional regulator [Cellulomonas composti]|uniref:Transcriptional regulator n=2 Tax=Cellulomonas composti TaxID=266130 RepID=A0A511J7R9_9CELL|nr:helix-turn-helix transcriptional regulator [Cellulomonas composti]GEL94028.1 transcriptional regulator [Cellulomonas composti]
MALEDTPQFVISAAATLAGMHPQTLRQYDRLGLVSPRRTAGRGRRYSLRDVATLREVQRLSQDEGVNLAGIKRILELESEVERLQRQVDYLRAYVEPGRRVFTADRTGDVVAVRRPARATRQVAESGALVLWRPSR